MTGQLPKPVRREPHHYMLPPAPGLPTQLLADVEAKRAVVKRHHQREGSPSCAECGGYTAITDAVRGIVHYGYAVPWPCPTLRLLALPYADHPDHRPEWRPNTPT